MSTGLPRDTGKPERAPAQSRPRIIVGLFMMLLGIPPLLNALGNPRVQALHGADVLGLVASGLAFGIGLGLLLSRRIFRGG